MVLCLGKEQGGVDGTRTREGESHDPSEKQASPALPSPARDAEPSRVATSRPARSRLASVPNAERDDVAADLERRIVEAELAGRTTIANVLARRLEAHRAASGSGNVVELRFAKKSTLNA